jgi:hypothetical protein
MPAARMALYEQGVEYDHVPCSFSTSHSSIRRVEEQ